MKKSTPFFYFISLLLFTSGCSEKIVHYVNEASSFEEYNSYITVNYKVNEEELSPEGKKIFNQITSLINEQMDKRDYNQNRTNPDLVVRYELISNQVTEVNVNNSPFFSPFPRSYFTTRTFLESALLIEVTDRESKNLVWQASVDLNNYSKKNRTEEILRQAIKQLFNTYPYRAGSDTPDKSLIE